MIKSVEFHRMIRKTGRKPSECKCNQCKLQCSTPCLGTPNDILALINAGYGLNIFRTVWAAGMIMKVIDRPVEMYQLEMQSHGCVLFKDGLCSIHYTGLKPTEGKLSHHTHKLETFEMKKSLSWNVAKTWLDPDNRDVITEIERKLAQVHYK